MDEHQEQIDRPGSSGPISADMVGPGAGPKPAEQVKLLLGLLATGVRRWRASLPAGDGASTAEDLRAAFAGLPLPRLLWGALGLALVIYLLSNVYVVKPGEVGVVRRFGAVVQPRAPEGLNYALPRPFDRVDIVNVSQVRREVVGVLNANEDHDHPEPPAKLQVLSGDTNIIDFEVVVQYQISNPADFLFNVKEPAYHLMRNVVRHTVIQLAGNVPVDNILTKDRQRLQEVIRSEAQAILDSYKSGLTIVNVNLQKAFPPDEVADAFVAVSSAREDKERAINEAQGYANSLLPEARGQAQQIIAQADAYRSEAVNRARGAAQAFEAMLVEFKTNSEIYGKDVTLYRLYLETMETVLPKVGVYVVNTKNGGPVTLRLMNDSSGSSSPTISSVPPSSPGPGGQFGSSVPVLPANLEGQEGQ